MRLWILRHGRTEANEKRLYCGATDLPLSMGGRQELLRIREEICLPNPAALRLITSGMRRTDETLQLLLGKSPHARVAGLREMDFGRFEMRGYEDLRFDPAYIAWISGDNEANIAPGGESGRQFCSRVLAAFEGIVQQGGDAFIVAHGGTIAQVMNALFPGQKNRYQWQPGYGRGYLLTGSHGSWKYEEYP